ncbi:MAG TPA: hypothetical protein VIY47_11765, partial [Ignavibacteriaceae bacterium]
TPEEIPGELVRDKFMSFYSRKYSSSLDGSEWVNMDKLDLGLFSLNQRDSAKFQRTLFRCDATEQMNKFALSLVLGTPALNHLPPGYDAYRTLDSWMSEETVQLIKVEINKLNSWENLHEFWAKQFLGPKADAMFVAMDALGLEKSPAGYFQMMSGNTRSEPKMDRELELPFEMEI